MVIDVKDDEGNITMKLNTGNKQVDKNTLDIVDGKNVEKLHDNNIYPIARIVTFKDSKLAKNILNGHLKKVMDQFGLMVKAIALLTHS